MESARNNQPTNKLCGVTAEHTGGIIIKYREIQFGLLLLWKCRGTAIVAGVSAMTAGGKVS